MFIRNKYISFLIIVSITCIIKRIIILIPVKKIPYQIMFFFLLEIVFFSNVSFRPLLAFTYNYYVLFLVNSWKGVLLTVFNWHLEQNLSYLLLFVLTFHVEVISAFILKNYSSNCDNNSKFGQKNWRLWFCRWPKKSSKSSVPPRTLLSKQKPINIVRYAVFINPLFGKF